AATLAVSGPLVSDAILRRRARHREPAGGGRNRLLGARWWIRHRPADLLDLPAPKPAPPRCRQRPAVNRSAALLIGAFLLSFPASPRTRVPASFSPHSPSPRLPVPPSVSSHSPSP